MDTRVKTSMKDLQIQHDFSFICYTNIKKCRSALKEISEMKDERNFEIGKEFSKYLRTFSSLHNLFQQSDMPLTSQMISGFKDSEKGFKKLWLNEIPNK